MDLVGPALQGLGEIAQAVHGHPGAVGAAAAGGPGAGGGRLQQGLVRHRLLHLVEDAVVGGDDELGLRPLLGRPDELGGGAHLVGHGDDLLRRLRMDEDGRPGVLGPEFAQLLRLEGLVDDAAALPQEHVGAGDLADVLAQVTVRRPEDGLAPVGQVAHHPGSDGGGHDPVGPRLHLGGGIGVDHHGPVGVGIAEGTEFPGGAAQVQGALRLQGGHEDPLLGAQDPGRFAHETDTGHHQGSRLGAGAEAGHLQGVADEAAGLLGQGLEGVVHVVVGHQGGVLARQ